MLFAVCLHCFVRPPACPPAPTLGAVCRCLLIPEGLAATPWDPTSRGNTVYGAPFVPGCRGLWPRSSSQPAQPAAREKPGCPRWLVAPPPTHTDSPGCQQQLALLFKACDGEFRHWKPPARQHTSHKPMDKGCQKGQRPASCLGVVLKGLHRRGSPSSGSQKA